MPIDPDTLARRRRAFMEHIGPAAAAMFPAAPVAVRSHDVEYRYRPDNDFYYLTGFAEAEAVCLLLPGQDKGEEFVLFVPPRDVERETWTGKRAGVEGAIESYGADVAYPIDKLDEKIHEYVAPRERLYCPIGRNAAFTQRVMAWLQHWQSQRPRTGRGPTAVLDPGEIVHEMRLFKSPEELVAMRRAIAIAADAHIAAMRAAKPGVHEYEIEALLDYTFRRLGGWGPAYPSIVASGANATILHYTTNNRAMAEDELLLIDAGAEFDGYCADITRTYPVAMSFSQRQRDIYDLVLRAQIAAIEMIRPGVRFDEVHHCAVRVLVDGLVSLGVMAGNPSEIIEKELYKPFYMHRTSHWLGLDVHDVGKYKISGESRQLEPGMVLTVEPGIYVGNQVEHVDDRWRGIGVRIEDDVLVTADGHEVLSATIPKTIEEITAARRSAAA
ncbi:MAG TPA: aminopeptidase P N-terminal domain-containing protein [Candidatus Kryptonia bacterium]|nr:aminopeptidase P N-terminal domain-containing protein [Candidatus Kryptonia bacterium]